jgi:RHS repeat-associated protein
MSESATDFVSGDGQLRFDRHYNSNPLNPDGGGLGWKNAYEARHIEIIDKGLKSPLHGATDYAASSSGVYSSASAACEQGVADIVNGIGGATGNPAYTGVTASYSGNGQCQLSNGEVVGVLTTDGAAAYSNPDADASSGVAVFRPDGSEDYFTCLDGTCVSLGQSELSLTASSAGFMLTAQNGDVENYDLSGNLLQITARDGYVRTIARNADDTIHTVTDNHGRQLVFAYNANGALSQLILPDQGTVTYGYDPAGRLTSVTYPDLSTIGYQYTNPNYLHALTAWIDESNTTYASWTYDNTTGMATTSALAGNVDTSTLSYNGDATTVTDNLGIQRTYNYLDSAGGLRLASIVGPVCAACIGQSMSYDANGYLKTAEDWNGHTTDYTYSPKGLLQQRREGLGTPVQRTQNFTWDATLRVPLSRTVFDANGNMVSNAQWAYNTRGQPLARCEIDPANAAAAGYACIATDSVPAGARRWTYTYCDAVDSTQCPLVGLRLSVTGPRTDLAQTTTYTYYLDASATGCGTPGGACHQPGDLHTVTDALGHVITIASYDSDGRITRETDPNGVNTDLTYTPRGWLASRSVGGATTTFTYMPYGAVASITDPDGIATTYTYDAAHRLTDITDAAGNRLHYTLDAAGNKTAEQVYDASGTVRRSLTRTYNSLGELTAVVDGLNQTVFNAGYSDSYDADGNLVHSADGRGVQQQRGYDALNRLVQTIQDYDGTAPATENTTTAFSYDSLDRLTGVTDPDGLATTYSYDGLSDATGQTSPDTGSTTRTYDAAGNVLTRTDAKGTTATNSYDALDRLVGTTYPDSTQDVAYHYDEADSVTGCSGSSPVGRLTRIVEATVTTVYCYDAQGRVTRKQQVTASGTDTTSYAYTDAGRLSGMTYPDGSVVSYARDTDGRIQGISVTPAGGSAAVVVSAVTYLPFGPVSGYTLGNGQTIARAYDANYRLTDLTSPAFNLHVARDAIGDITAIGNSPGANPATESYGYDALNRLIDITEADGSTLESVTYDQTGDRLSKSGSGLAMGTYSYNPGTHQLIVTGNQVRTVDADGNTTSLTQAGITYGLDYNDRNRLAAVQEGTATVGTYTYNALGQRIQKTTGSSTERFGYDEASQLLAEAGATDRDYVWMNGIPIATIDTQSGTSTISYITADQLGTPRAVSDASGTAEWSWPYAGNAWGEQAPTSNGYTFNLRLPGQYYDAESETSYNIFRTYEPVTGQYLQSDPTGLVGGISTYAYVGDSPLGRIDPLGLQEVLFRIGGLLSEESIVPKPLIEPVKPLPPSAPAPQLPEDFPKIPADPTQCPGKGWEWRGASGTKPGDPRGGWYNPKKDWTLHPDMDHPEPIGPHWDWIDENGNKYRITPQAPPIDPLHPPIT